MVVQAVEGAGPEGAVIIEPLLRGLQAFGIEAANQLLAVAAAGDQPGFFQHFQMARDGRAGDGKGLGDFAHRGLAQRQPGQDGAAGGIGESSVGSIQVHNW